MCQSTCVFVNIGVATLQEIVLDTRQKSPVVITTGRSIAEALVYSN